MSDPASVPPGDASPPTSSSGPDRPTENDSGAIGDQQPRTGNRRRRGSRGGRGRGRTSGGGGQARPTDETAAESTEPVAKPKIGDTRPAVTPARPKIGDTRPGRVPEAAPAHTGHQPAATSGPGR